MLKRFSGCGLCLDSVSVHAKVEVFVRNCVLSIVVEFIVSCVRVLVLVSVAPF